jgi:hypothetical protein
MFTQNAAVFTSWNYLNYFQLPRPHIPIMHLTVISLRPELPLRDVQGGTVLLQHIQLMALWLDTNYMNWGGGGKGWQFTSTHVFQLQKNSKHVYRIQYGR